MSFKGIQGKYLKFKGDFKECEAEVVNKFMEIKPLNEEGELNLSAGAIIGFAIGLIVLAAVIPDAIGTFYATNTSAWLTADGTEDTKVTVLWWLIPLVIVAAVVMMIYRN